MNPPALYNEDHLFSVPFSKNGEKETVPFNALLPPQCFMQWPESICCQHKHAFGKQWCWFLRWRDRCAPQHSADPLQYPSAPDDPELVHTVDSHVIIQSSGRYYTDIKNFFHVNLSHSFRINSVVLLLVQKIAKFSKCYYSHSNFFHIMFENISRFISYTLLSEAQSQD